MLSKADNKTSNQSLGRNRADSAPKLNHSNMKNISQPTLEGVVLEVSGVGWLRAVYFRWLGLAKRTKLLMALFEAAEGVRELPLSWMSMIVA